MNAARDGLPRTMSASAKRKFSTRATTLRTLVAAGNFDQYNPTDLGFDMQDKLVPSLVQYLVSGDEIVHPKIPSQAQLAARQAGRGKSTKHDHGPLALGQAQKICGNCYVQVTIGSPVFWKKCDFSSISLVIFGPSLPRSLPRFLGSKRTLSSSVFFFVLFFCSYVFVLSKALV